MTIDTWITLGYWISSIGFLIASIVTYKAMLNAGQSGLKTVLTYLFIGTGTFFFVTVFQGFQKIGLWGISDPSMDVWWHIMFYMSMVSFYIGFKALSTLGSSDSINAPVNTTSGKTWGIISAVLIVIIFIIPKMADPIVSMYTSSKLFEIGVHHFIAFIMAGIVGAYLFSAKIFLGQVGKAIANPMLVAIWALALQHLWELLNESWKVIIVTDSVGEGVEKIFLTIAAICVIYAALNLKKLAKV